MDRNIVWQIVQETSYGLILLDRAGRVCLWNRWMEDRSRRHATNVEGKTLQEAFGERHQLSRRLVAVIERSFQSSGFSGRSHAFAPHPLPLRDPEHPRKWLIHSLTVRSFRTPDGQSYCLLEVHDTSHSHSRERLLRQQKTELNRRADELQTANTELEKKIRELDEFVYQVSHDLQEPLRKLVAFSDLLNEDLGGENLDEQVAQDLFYIRDSASRMSRMISDLLRLSRAGNSAMEWKPLALADCLREALDAISLRLVETDAKTLTDDLPTVHGDPRLLTQLYQNLASNGLKFVRDKIPCLHFTCEVIDGQSVFGVRDNGIGIDKEHAQAIFTPFKRLHARGEFEGTGIGLSICKTVVERHGGTLWVESEPGRGAHFRFTLGAERPAGVPDPAETVEGPAGPLPSTPATQPAG